jgi:hypothetical protein
MLSSRNCVKNWHGGVNPIPHILYERPGFVKMKAVNLR